MTTDHLRQGNHRAVARGLLGMLVALLFAGCGGGDTTPSSAPPPPPQAIKVTIAPDGVTVPAGGSVALAASVQNDASNSGVTWSISPDTGAGALSNQTATSVTYTAPANPPTSSSAISIIATSKADSSKSATAVLNLFAVYVVVDPSGATLDLGATQNFTASVSNDSSAMGVSWSISPATGAGTLSNATNGSVTYTAPATLPPPGSIFVVATSLADPSKSAQGSITLPWITVGVDPSSATVEAGHAQAFTASLQHDNLNAGVTWSLSPVSGPGTLSDVTSTTVTYNAPATAPLTPQYVTLTATSVTDPVAVSTASITLPQSTVSISPASALLPLGATLTVTASVSNDPIGAGVSWALAQGGVDCAPACGATSTVDATSVIYTPPATMPANAAVTLTATAVADPANARSATITLTTGSVELVPNDLNFGRVKFKFSKLMTATLTNTGSAALSYAGATLGGANAVKFNESDTCGTSIEAGMSCTITVTFLKGLIGSFSAYIDLSDGSTDSPQRITLHGIHTAKAASASAASERTALSAFSALSAPRPTGANRVGTRTMMMVDTARSEPFRSDGSRRRLLVRFWYPAAARADCRRAAYTAPSVWKYFGELTGATLPQVGTNSCQDAPVQRGAYPVVVFTHGYTGTFTDYTFLFEDLASRGYIVASVNHTYEATASAFPDGQLAKSVLGSHLGKVLRTDEQALRLALSARLADLKFVGDQLARLDRNAASPFAGHLDLASMAVAGHSFGGLTALETLQQDDRFRAAVTIDGVVPGDGFAPTLKPVLILDAGHDTWADDERSLWGNLRGSRFAVNLRHAEHVAPSDAAWLEPGVVNTGRMSPEQAMAATREYIAAFLDSELQGRPVDRLLTRPSTRYPEVQVGLPQR